MRSRGRKDPGNSISERFPTVTAISHRAAEPPRSFSSRDKEPWNQHLLSEDIPLEIATRSNDFSTGHRHFLNLSLNKTTLLPSDSIVGISSKWWSSVKSGNSSNGKICRNGEKQLQSEFISLPRDAKLKNSKTEGQTVEIHVSRFISTTVSSYPFSRNNTKM